MRITLIDDEAPMRKNLGVLLRKYAPDMEIIGEASGVESGLKQLENNPTDILFLDVEMKDGTGFDLLAQCENINFHIVFVTGHDKYAIKAFKYSAIDYLLKPVDPLELNETLSKLRNKKEANSRIPSISNLIDNRKRETQEKKVVLKDSESVYLVPVNEIVRCESDNNYTRFYLVDGRCILVSKTLKDFERLFDDQTFFRTHQSHLINLAFFNRLDKREGGIIYMKDGSSVPLAARRKDSFLDQLGVL